MWIATKLGFYSVVTTGPEIMAKHNAYSSLWSALLRVQLDAEHGWKKIDRWLDTQAFRPTQDDAYGSADIPEPTQAQEEDRWTR